MRTRTPNVTPKIVASSCDDMVVVSVVNGGDDTVVLSVISDGLVTSKAVNVKLFLMVKNSYSNLPSQVKLSVVRVPLTQAQV